MRQRFGYNDRMNNSICNLTPHSITIHALCVDGSGTPSFTIPPSGKVARLVFRKAFTTLMVTGWTIPVSVFGGVSDTIDLPSQYAEDQMIYIVSAMVREAHPSRTDLYSPGELLRDSAGQPIGCMGLVGNPFPVLV